MFVCLVENNFYIKNITDLSGFAFLSINEKTLKI